MIQSSLQDWPATELPNLPWSSSLAGWLWGWAQRARMVGGWGLAKPETAVHRAKLDSADKFGVEAGDQTGGLIGSCTRLRFSKLVNFIPNDPKSAFFLPWKFLFRLSQTPKTNEWDPFYRFFPIDFFDSIRLPVSIFIQKLFSRRPSLYFWPIKVCLSTTHALHSRQIKIECKVT